MPQLFRLVPRLFLLALCLLAAAHSATGGEPGSEVRRFLYVAVPGVRNYLEYGGHGLLVYDIDQGHKFVKRIATSGLDDAGKPLNVKGICASALTQRIYVGTTRQLMCLDLVSDELLWQRSYEGGSDRMAIAPDGRTIYLPSLEGPYWHVVDAATGDVLSRVQTDSGSHNTIYGPDGTRVYLAGLRSPWLSIADPDTHEVVATAGPFSAPIRPFTIDSKQRYCFVNVNELLGFEIGDLATGKMLHRVEVQGYEKGTPKRHGCPSHGIGMTPDEREIWVTDAVNQRLHIFDATQMPPKQVAEVLLRDEPGWITFSLDGRYAYPSTGDVVDVQSRQVVCQLADETGRDVQSEKMVEVHFRGAVPVRTGDQFGIGRAP
jgi:DNA-binding beta-propeller fold protein YncE